MPRAGLPERWLREVIRACPEELEPSDQVIHSPASHEPALPDRSRVSPPRHFRDDNRRPNTVPTPEGDHARAQDRRGHRLQYRDMVGAPLPPGARTTRHRPPALGMLFDGATR